ncbi:hypothetical protein WDU94_010635 [Cyamophila willieti]
MGSLWIDYGVFGVLLLASISVSMWSKFSGPKEKTKADYVFAQNNVSVVEMIMSIAGGFLGVRIFLGFPSELYYRGSEMWECVYGAMITFPIVLYFFVPVYLNLGVTSVYQYLDMRFKSALVRRLASGTYLLRSLLNLGATLFAPCVALKTVMGSPYSVSIIGIGSIAILLTILGNLRSAITADVVQCIIMLGCSSVMILQGLYEADGPVNIVRTNKSRHRLDFFNWDLDPTVRTTTISAVLGQLFMSLSIYGCQQNNVQRYCSMGSFKRLAQTLWANVPVMAILYCTNWVVGMVIFALYADCDPKKSGLISDNDEILPFYVVDKFYFLPGFLGLVMASLFNGTLSFLISNLNSMASVLWEDFVCQIPAMKSLPDNYQLVAMKMCGVVCGIITMGIAFFVAHLSGVIEASQLMSSATTGPLLGVFLLAMFCPSANWKGAVAGMIVSHVVILWITIGGLLIKQPPRDLPTSTDGCTNTTFGPHISSYDQSALLALFNESIHSSYHQSSLVGLFNDTARLIEEDLEIRNNFNEESVIHFIYRISYMYYSMMGTLITIVVGLLVSSFASCTSDDEFEYNEKLLHPLALKLSKLCGGGTKRSYSTQTQTTPRHNIDTISENGIHSKYKETPPV